MQKIIDWLKEHKIIVLAMLLVVIVGIAYVAGRRSATQQTEQQKPAVVTQGQTRDAKALQQQLDISRANADALRQQLAAVQAGQRTPVATYYVTASTVERAATIVERQIKADDPTLPMAAREQSDRTVVTPITQDKDGKELAPKDQKVDVYKINLRKDHRIKAGVSVIDGKSLMTVGYEQGRFEALAHFDGSRYKGATVTYNIIEW